MMPSDENDAVFQWQPAPWAEAATLIQVLLGLSSPPAEGSIPGLNVSVTRLPFYQRFRLFWFSRQDEGERRLNFFMLHAPGGAVLLDGTGDGIHLVNRNENLVLAPALQDDYLRFFMFFMRGQGAAFCLLEDHSLLIAPDDPARAGAFERLQATARPLQLLGVDGSGSGTFWGIVEYANDIYACTIAVASNGDVHMLQDEQVFDDYPGGMVAPILPLDDPAQVLRLQPAPSGSGRPPSVPPPGVGAGSVPGFNPSSDRDVTQRFVAVLLEHALYPVRRHTLLERFNPLANKHYPIVPLAQLVQQSWPVIAIESEHPFVEELIAELLVQHFPAGAQPVTLRGTSDADGNRLVIDRNLPDHALVLLPLQAYRSVSDVEWVAHEIAVREVAALIGCERLADIPEPLRRAVDLHLRLPVINDEIFRDQFRRILSAPLPQRWRTGGTHWVRFVLATDFHQVVKAGLAPAAALRYIRQRVQARLSQVDTRSGPGLRDLHGLSEARQFAEDLIADIRAARDGEIAWTDVDPGILLVGPPGTGKTSLARAIAKDCGIKFISASASGWQATGHLGDHIRAMRASFAEARRYAPSILFIDEIDSIGNRGNFAGQSAQYAIEVVNALLELIQGIDPAAPVFVIAATNHVDLIDPALRRAGRLDRTVTIPYPNVEALKAIFDYYLSGPASADRLASGIDTTALGVLAFGLTGADVETFVRGAARRARKAGRPINQDDLVAEVTRKPRSSSGAVRLTPDDMRRVALHEAGHALARYLGSRGGQDISYVSIVPRADGTLGFVAAVPSPNVLMTRAQYREQLQVFLAGRAAEELEYGPDGVSAGAGGESQQSDLAVASRVATGLVCQQGMAESGQMLWSNQPTGLQRDEAERLLRDAYAEVRGRLDSHRAQLQKLTDALVTRQELSGDEVRQILASGQAQARARVGRTRTATRPAGKPARTGKRRT